VFLEIVKLFISMLLNIINMPCSLYQSLKSWDFNLQDNQQSSTKRAARYNKKFERMIFRLSSLTEKRARRKYTYTSQDTGALPLKNLSRASFAFGIPNAKLQLDGSFKICSGYAGNFLFRMLIQ
jgi:hypothetical protein